MQKNYSIKELCKTMSISKSFYHKLQKEGRGPSVIRLGSRVIITDRAAQAWIAFLETDEANSTKH